MDSDPMQLAPHFSCGLSRPDALALPAVSDTALESLLAVEPPAPLRDAHCPWHFVSFAAHVQLQMHLWWRADERDPYGLQATEPDRTPFLDFPRTGLWLDNLRAALRREFLDGDDERRAVEHLLLFKLLRPTRLPSLEFFRQLLGMIGTRWAPPPQGYARTLGSGRLVADRLRRQGEQRTAAAGLRRGRAARRALGSDPSRHPGIIDLRPEGRRAGGTHSQEAA